MESKFENVTITMSGNTVTNSQLTGITIQDNHKSVVSEKDAEILRELQQVRKQLENTEPIIADAVADLEKAIQARDKPTIAKLLGKFSSEAVKGVMRTVASKALLAWMGIA